MLILTEGRRRAAEVAQQERAWLAWTIAALTRAKHMPALKDIIDRPARKAPRRAMTGDQMLTMARMWSAVAGPENKGGQAE